MKKLCELLHLLIELFNNFFQVNATGTHLTSSSLKSQANTTLKLRGTKYKNSLLTQEAKLNQDIVQFKHLEKEALTVRNDMTVNQQHKFHRLLLRRMKIKRLKSRISEGRGRKLKCEEFPELPAPLEFAFGDGDRLQHSAGGLEAHSKLYDETMYKASDNMTVMREALDLVRSLAPEDFKISLSILPLHLHDELQARNDASKEASPRG